MMKIKSLLTGLLTGAFFVGGALAQGSGQLASGQVWGNPTAAQGLARPTSLSPLLGSLAVTSADGGIGLTGNPNLTLTNTQLGLATGWGALVDLTASSATAPEGGGSFNITSSVGAANPSSAFKIGLSGTATCNSGSSDCWAQSNVVTLGAGGAKRGGIPLELDLNNFWGDYTGAPSSPYAANLMLTGQNTNGVNGGYAHSAINIEFAQNFNPMWNYGIHFGPAGFNPFNTATIFDESNSATSLKINGTHNTAVIDISGASTTGFLFKAIGFSVVSTGETIIGGAGVSTGALNLSGLTSGNVKIQPQDVAGTYNFNLPTTAGSAGQALLSGGGGAAPMTFGTLGVAGGGTGLTTLTSSAIYKGNGTGALAVSSLTDDGTTFAINTNKMTVDLATGNANIAGSLSAAIISSSNEVRAAGDLGGAVGTVSYTGTTSTTIGAGTGTVKMSSATSANSVGWIKIRNGTTEGWVPYWSTNAP